MQNEVGRILEIIQKALRETEQDYFKPIIAELGTYSLDKIDIYCIRSETAALENKRGVGIQ